LPLTCRLSESWVFDAHIPACALARVTSCGAQTLLPALRLLAEWEQQVGYMHYQSGRVCLGTYEFMNGTVPEYGHANTHVEYVRHVVWIIP